MIETDSRILWLLKGLLGLCLLTPLLMSGAFLFPYTAPKAFVFRILVEIAAFFYFYLCLKYPDFRPRKTALNLAILAFLIVWLLAAFFGVDFYLSFWGNLERMLGFWGLFHFILFFGISVSVFKTDDGWLALVKVSVAASSLVALLAIIQRVVSLGDLMPQVSRVYGTVGNPAFLASYLIFNIFLAGYLILGEKNKLKFIVYGLALIINCFTLLFTGTRGAFLGLTAGLVVLLILFSFFYPQKSLRRYFVVALILFLILFGLLFVFRSISLVQKNSFLQRLTSISLKDTTSQNRLILWQQSWRAWQEKPILGWGPENFEVAANKYFDPRLSQYEAWYDRAHNFIFDYGVVGGWLGLLAYLGIFVVAIWGLFKTIRHSERSGSEAKNLKIDSSATPQNDKLRFFFASIFISLLAAYLVQNFFVFDSFVSYLMLFFVLALIGFSWQKNKLGGSPVLKTRTIFLGVGPKILLGMSVLLVIFSIYFLNIKAITASNLAHRVFSSPPEKFQETASLLSQALANKTFASEEIVYQAVLDYLDKINQAPQLAQNENFYKLTSEKLTEIIERSSVQSRNYVALAWLNLYFYDGPSKINSAIDLAQKVKTIAPGKKDAYMILIAAYSLSGQKEKAWQVVEETKKIDEAMGGEIQNYWRSFQ